MPELPDIELYHTCLRKRVMGRPFSEFKTYNPFILRTVMPKPVDLVGLPVVDLWRIGKRVAFEFDNGNCMVIHLMVSGRFRWFGPDARVMRKISHASWNFEDGTLVLTEASSRKRAGIWLFPDRERTRSLDPRGVEPLTCTREEFWSVLKRENRTLKRALTNPHWFAGIGNAYSDEILHAAKLSPFKLTLGMEEAEVSRLYDAVQSTLILWRDKLVAEFLDGEKFPGAGDVTAFRPDFAAHGKFKSPCPVCGKPIQRIVYADNETNYCAVCQTEGRILMDRSLSRLLKDDWPKSFGDED